MSRSDLRAQPNWYGDPLHGIRAQGGQVRAGSSRRAGSSQRAPRCRAELGPAMLVSFCGLNSSPGTSLWRQGGEGRRDPPSSPKHPCNSLFHCPMDPSNAHGDRSMGWGWGWMHQWASGSLPWSSRKDASQPGDTSFFFFFWLHCACVLGLGLESILACSGSMGVFNHWLVREVP